MDTDALHHCKPSTSIKNFEQRNAELEKSKKIVWNMAAEAMIGLC